MCVVYGSVPLKLGVDALSTQLAAVTIDCPAPATVDNAARAALRCELGWLLAQFASHDEQIMMSRFELSLLVSTLTGWAGRPEPCCTRDARVTPVLVSMTTRRKLVMHTHRRAVDEHVGCPCSGIMSDSDEAPLSPHAPCALCADD